ncbi:acetyl-CoA carboxylase carboxyltransferase subunit alpha [Candidatus Cytomitobacter primus]|uniref:Acetyl-coenzyme A carboxylase carboxyl transferase subunit alpha n=1 Tax=Candidatus Cytomitobacter primus TaxID=2066024 RepID=A0A5C0UEN1_9PROT|nr:acetyl-CoA carboxylase carboxyltransferase subunit alpha [Candidatus Cytomitobacter primus]QEK38556.1 acetyl-CoA carboxylase carboxyltransferase subunit alpha [Candidatus Cytomitobacter primus]
MHVLNFEEGLYEIEKKISELKSITDGGDTTFLEVINLEKQLIKKLEELYKNLTPWQKVQVARHPNRPHGLDYIDTIFEDFFELCGDRCNANDNAIIGGIGKIDNQSVMVIAHEKGHDIKSRAKHNYGMGLPQGYKKAYRLMEVANELKIPVLTLIDTSGAYPGVISEEQGQGHVLAKCLELCSSLEVPNISVIIGEGGSGGAISLALSNVVLMLEHSIYSVISPEGCAAILWKDQNFKERAAESQKLTAQDLHKFGMINEIIPEPIGGSHKFRDQAMNTTKKYIMKHLKKLIKQDAYMLKKTRRQKFLDMGNNIPVHKKEY